MYKQIYIEEPWLTTDRFRSEYNRFNSPSNYLCMMSPYALDSPLWVNLYDVFFSVWVPYSQKGVDGGSNWRARTRETEVRLDGWCEGGGCATNRKEWRALVHITEWVLRGHFCLTLCSSDRPPVLWWLSPGEGRDAVTWCGWDKLKGAKIGPTLNELYSDSDSNNFMIFISKI